MEAPEESATLALCEKYAVSYKQINNDMAEANGELAEYPAIEIANDIEGKEFKVIVWRKEHQISTQKTGNITQMSTQKTSGSTQEQILNILREYPQTSRKELAKIIGITEDDTQDGTQGGTQDDDLDKWIEYQVAVYPKITTEELASLSGKGLRTIKRRIAKMPHIVYVGSGYSGHWEVKPKEK